MASDHEVAEESASILIRAATREDLPAVLDLIEPLVEQGRLLPRTTDELDLLMASGFVAICDGQLVGFAALEVYSKKLAELRSLAVHEEYRRRGIGRRLVEACLDLAEQRRIFEVMVITSEEEFFRGCGFDFTLPREKKALFYAVRDTP